MKVLSVLIPEQALLFLRGRGVVTEHPDDADIETIVAYLQDGQYDACVINLDASGLGIYLPREVRESEYQDTTHRFVTWR